MRTVEIAMRILCFVVGIMLAFGVRVRVSDGDAREVFANVLLIFVWLSAVLALLILPWALPLRT